MNADAIRSRALLDQADAAASSSSRPSGVAQSGGGVGPRVSGGVVINATMRAMWSAWRTPSSRMLVASVPGMSRTCRPPGSSQTSTVTVAWSGRRIP